MTLLQVFVVLLLVCPARSCAQEADRLPDTALLTWQDDLADRMMAGLHKFIEAKLARSVQGRAHSWNRDCASRAAYEKSIEPNRNRFRKILGIRDPRVPAYLERFGSDDAPAMVAAGEGYRVCQVRWPVFDGVWGEGLLA
jgi:hypothetical protein